MNGKIVGPSWRSVVVMLAIPILASLAGVALHDYVESDDRVETKIVVRHRASPADDELCRAYQAWEVTTNQFVPNMRRVCGMVAEPFAVKSGE